MDIEAVEFTGDCAELSVEEQDAVPLEAFGLVY